MLGQLLILARGEQNELRVESELVDVGALVSEVCRKFQGKAELRHVSLKLHLAGETNALSDPALLRSILMNLIDNALEYSPAGEAVTVEVGSGDGRIEIRVINAVHDVSEQDLPRLFERFWRKDAARSSDGHTGLGLSLARVFAKALGC
jgi:signal transduction histidine kinase